MVVVEKRGAGSGLRLADSVRPLPAVAPGNVRDGSFCPAPALLLAPAERGPATGAEAAAAAAAAAALAAEAARNAAAASAAAAASSRAP